MLTHKEWDDSESSSTKYYNLEYIIFDGLIS